MRRWGRIERGQAYRLRPGAYAVLLRGRDVLLTVQEDRDGGPEVQLPGGGIERGEPILPALRREVLEETGWVMGPARRLGAYRRFAFMPEYGMWAEKLCHVFLARPVRALGPPTEAGHHAIWAPLETAAALVASEADRAVLRGLAGRALRGRG